jgi:caffeoyl-CoA O-methyltransferase
MAARLPADGRITTIEADENVATMAAAHIAASPDAAKVEQIVGDARAIVQELDGPFDLVFIDAWKPDYAHYYEHVLPKLSEHGIIVADNVLWKGRVAGLGEEDEQTRSLRAFNDHVQADPRVHNALLTVGDGLLVIWRAPA